MFFKGVCKVKDDFIDIKVEKLVEWDEPNDSDILPYIHSKVGSSFIRISESKFELDEGDNPIFIVRQNL